MSHVKLDTRRTLAVMRVQANRQDAK